MLKKIFLGITLFCLLLGGCGTPTPPTEFAPDGEIVQKAIALSLDLTQQHLTQQLKASHPQLEISNINVKKLEPVYIQDLPSYHLQGNYKLKIQLPRQKETQENSSFDIYIQRQREGKTWRLLKQQAYPGTSQAQWRSYLIR